MRNKILLVGGLLLVTLGLFGCAAPAADTPSRTINVTGSSQVFLSPDIAYISIGVRTRDADVGKAVADNNALVAKVLAALHKFGIADEDLRTINFNLYYYDEYSPTGERTGVTYEVDNTIYVTLRDLSQMGAILEKAINAGANSIYGIQFDVADRSQYLPKARQAAVDSARTQAEELAKAAGVELGEIVSISFSSSGFPSPVYETAPVEGKGGGGGAPYISGGQLSFTVDVSMVFEIK